MNRYFSPSEELQPLFLYDDFKDLLCLIFLQFILWKEEHSHTVISLVFQFNSERQTDFLEKCMRNLSQNTNTVSGLSFCILSGSVLQMLNDAQCSCHCVVSLPALDIYNCTDTTVVMFKTFAVQALLRCFHFFPHSRFSFLLHFYMFQIHDF